MPLPQRLERYREIARYISEKTGLTVDENAVRKWAWRPADPLPLERFSGRITADHRLVDAWIERQRGVRRKRPQRPQ